MGRGSLLAGKKALLVQHCGYIHIHEGSGGGEGTSLSTVSTFVCFCEAERGLAPFAVRWARTS